MIQCQKDDLKKILVDSTRSAIHTGAFSASQFAVDMLFPALQEQNMINDPQPAACVNHYDRWRNRIEKRISRILDGSAPLPADWAGIWLSVLPEQIQNKARNRIAACFSLAGIPAITISGRGQVIARLFELSRAFADVMTASSPAQDGHYSFDDGQEALQLLQNQLAELIHGAMAEVTSIAASTGITPDCLKYPSSAVIRGNHAFKAS